jgi:hypothetical protein
MSHHVRACVCVLPMMAMMSWAACGSVQIEEGL